RKPGISFAPVKFAPTAAAATPIARSQPTSKIRRPPRPTTNCDLTHDVPLLTDKAGDTSGKRWDIEQTTGLRKTAATVVNVEYHRDIVPILQRSCVACHSEQDGKQPAAGLVLDDDS